LSNKNFLDAVLKSDVLLENYACLFTIALGIVPSDFSPEFMRIIFQSKYNNEKNDLLGELITLTKNKTS
jgi:hypothetical protein